MASSALPRVLCIFEDERFPGFFPLSLGRPVFDITIGTQSLRGRLVDELNPESLALLCRPYLAAVLREDESRGGGRGALVNEIPEGEILFLNGRLLSYEKELGDLCAGLKGEAVLHKKGIVVAARLSGERAASLAAYIGALVSDENVEKAIREIKRASASDGAKGNDDGEDRKDASRGKALAAWAQENRVKLQETGVRLLSQYWQVIGENRNCIVDDFGKNPLRGTAPETELFRGVELINENDIVIGSGVEVRSGTVLDASEGAIIIANNARIEPNAIICGPCAIGEGSIVRGGAKLGPGTTLGKMCRIGGEVEECIFAPYSNKQHEGFMGHSYTGSWVNIGAGSCTSDLKNNYGLVKAWSAGRMRETGRRFLGATIGDHSKIAIGSRLNTGTVIGFNSNVLAVGFPPKFVPSFSWRLDPEAARCELAAAVETAKIMMDRRNVVFTAAHADLFKTLERFSRLGGNAL
jgi:UDP-N-acetylglucosamine diphosphorylase / glucose-1-phosphate thymidylyltransferase / UDP-N-acetylgalactosamine diphosphorylase / glucosamine-1-phosphate N-acetyltransferase / galactosamine-1-phosphate N-acetyltransferase